MLEFKAKLVRLLGALGEKMRAPYDRLPASYELLSDRWLKAKGLGFDQNTSIYESSYIYADVSVGKEYWIEPMTLIDRSSGLAIGDYCTISAGVYTHPHYNIKATLTSGKSSIERPPLAIGAITYVVLNVIVSKGVAAANSFVKNSYRDNVVIAGNPVTITARATVSNDAQASFVKSSL